MPTALRATSLPYALESDYFDPHEDGADVMWIGTQVQNLSSTSGTLYSTLQVDPAVDFYWMMTTLQADVLGAADAGADPYNEGNIPLPLVKIRIKDAGSGKNLENIQLPVGSVAGFGERCYRLNAPRRIAASTTLTFAWTPLIAAGTTYTNLYLTLHGYIKPAGS